MTELSGPNTPVKTGEPDPRGRARLVAAGAGCLWLVLAGALALMSLAAAAVSVAAFAIFAPWALLACFIAVMLLARPPSRRVLVASTVLAALSTALGVLALLGSTEDFQTGNLTFVLASAAAAAYSALALRRLPASPRSP